MKKNWLKWALCLVLAVAMLTCVATAAIEQGDVAADANAATITVTDGKLTVVANGTADKQYVLIQVKTDLKADTAEALLTAAKAAQSAPYDLNEDKIFYIDQDAAASNGKVTFSNFQPKSAATSLFILGGEAEPQIIGAMVAHGVTVGGTVTLKGAAATDTAAKVEILNGTEVVGEADVTVSNGTGTYSIEAVPAGTYTLKVSGTAGKYVAREYAITVADAEVTQAVEICPLGDANGDGRITLGDATAILNHTRLGSTNKLTGYAFDCADTVNDSRITLGDATAILNHTRLGSTNKLW